MANPIKNVGRMPADHASNGFYGQDIISVSQFDKPWLDYIFWLAHEMRVLG